MYPYKSFVSLLTQDVFYFKESQVNEDLYYSTYYHTTYDDGLVNLYYLPSWIGSRRLPSESDNHD